MFSSRQMVAVGFALLMMAGAQAASPQNTPDAAAKKPEVGASRLTLFKSQTVKVAGDSTDPFADLQPVEVFKSSDGLGYAFQVCRAEASDAPVKVTAKIVRRDQKNAKPSVAPAREMTPYAIPDTGNCYIVRAGIPLKGFPAGKYRLTLSIADGGKTYDLHREFEVH